MSAIRDLIATLVAFDTTSHRSNLDCIRFIQGVLEGHGATTRLTFDDGGGKANIHATLGPDDRPGVLLSGHTDVVPVEGQDWTSDPFRLEERDDRLIGRGTADMKSFIALCLALAPEFAARGLSVPLHFAFSYDEEIGCLGVRRLIADLAELPVKPSLCIVGEPTGLRVVTGHKGKRSLRCHVHGREGHSAMNHRAVNAVENAARLVAHLADMQAGRRAGGPHDHGYDPPWSTIHTGLIQGGTALNIVPRDCWFEFEFRTIPGESPDTLMDELRAWAATAIDPAARIEWTLLDDTIGLHMDDQDEATRFVAALAGANDTMRVSFATEAGLFREIGIPTIVCGPGSIEQAHKPDEYITLEQLAQGEAFLRRLMDRICLSG
ncbi:MAG: acetylornithine deacetylase [Alphaproteobacteria bacterium]|nr:acetylornithine deacetylase [Alphaproteobacteria bacterium]